MLKAKNPEEVMARKNVSPDVYTDMLALMHRCQVKAIYNFENSIAHEIMESTEDPDCTFPISCIRQLPYHCIAVQTTGVSIIDQRSGRILEEYPENVFFWLEGDVLHTAWQYVDDEYLYANMLLKDSMTIDDCFDSIVTENLKHSP